jgi:hypothetical protein
MTASVGCGIQLRKCAIEIPREREPAAFVVLESLEFFDEIKPNSTAARSYWLAFTTRR